MKHPAYELDGNIYKGWAVGLHDRRRDGVRMMILTGLVMAVQLVAPVLMFVWSATNITSLGRPEYLWQHEVDWVTLLTKLLGTVMMILVYVNGDLHLERLDRQTSVFEKVFKNVSAKWMFIDAMCNSGCVAGSACVLPLLMWSSDKTPMTIVLDVFGLLFLTSLDDYA